MQKFKASIIVMPLPEILDPQGNAVKLGLKNLGLTTAESVRIGRHITMELSADGQPQAEALVEDACRRLLANLIMEGYTYTVEPITDGVPQQG